MISGIVTAILLALFVIGSVWAFSPRRKPEFEAAARLAIDDEDPEAGANETKQEESSQ